MRPGRLASSAATGSTRHSFFPDLSVAHLGLFERAVAFAGHAFEAVRAVGVISGHQSPFVGSCQLEVLVKSSRCPKHQYRGRIAQLVQRTAKQNRVDSTVLTGRRDCSQAVGGLSNPASHLNIWVLLPGCAEGSGQPINDPSVLGRGLTVAKLLVDVEVMQLIDRFDVEAKGRRKVGPAVSLPRQRTGLFWSIRIETERVTGRRRRSGAGVSKVCGFGDRLDGRRGISFSDLDVIWLSRVEESEIGSLALARWWRSREGNQPRNH